MNVIKKRLLVLLSLILLQSVILSPSSYEDLELIETVSAAQLEDDKQDQADKEEQDNQESGIRPEDVEDAVIHEPVLPKDYNLAEIKKLPEEGTHRDYHHEMLTVNGYDFPFVDKRGNTGYGEDFEKLNETLNQNLVAYVGRNNIHTFFGHYYDLTGTGVFNPLADQDLLDVGTEVVVTDEDGMSKGYEITQIIEFLHTDQQKQFYGDDYMPDLAYNGNDTDMIYIQYCRWDIQNGLLITNIGYRIW